MIRTLTTDQRKLFEQYSKITKTILDNYDLLPKAFDEIVWDVLSREEMWTLAIDKEYGGKGKSWQEMVIAIDGVLSRYFNIEILDLFISQVSSIYLVSQYGTEIIKMHYLPRLMKGEIITVFHPYSRVTDRSKKMLVRRSRAFIYFREIDKRIIFYIYEKNTYRRNDSAYQSLKPVLNTKNLYIAKDVSISALHDLLNFERLFYAIISASFANKVCAML